MKTVEFYDESAVIIQTAREKARFAKVRCTIAKLKEENLPLNWDILYNCLKEGNIQDAYAQWWANEHHENWNRVEVRNELRAKFDCIGDAYNKYKFPQAWVTRNPDGSFDINEKAIEEDVRRRHTATITEDEAKAISDIVAGYKKLGIFPSQYDAYFYVENGEIIPRYYAIAKVVNTKED